MNVLCVFLFSCGGLLFEWTIRGKGREAAQIWPWRVRNGGWKQWAKLYPRRIGHLWPKHASLKFEAGLCDVWGGKRAIINSLGHGAGRRLSLRRARETAVRCWVGGHAGAHEAGGKGRMTSGRDEGALGVTCQGREQLRRARTTGMGWRGTFGGLLWGATTLGATCLTFFFPGRPAPVMDQGRDGVTTGQAQAKARETGVCIRDDHGRERRRRRRSSLEEAGVVR